MTNVRPESTKSDETCLNLFHISKDVLSVCAGSTRWGWGQHLPSQHPPGNSARCTAFRGGRPSGYLQRWSAEYRCQLVRPPGSLDQ